jgi:micrococcal nuclease
VAPEVYFKNCGQARKAHKAPLYRGQPGYRADLDKDGDGVACGK